MGMWKGIFGERLHQNHYHLCRRQYLRAYFNKWSWYVDGKEPAVAGAGVSRKASLGAKMVAR